MEKIPLEIIHQIVEHLPCHSTVNFAGAIASRYGAFRGISSKEVFRSICSYRKSPLRLLSDFKDPAEILKGMIFSRSFITGSRALGYFYPQFEAHQSRWEFYCEDYYGVREMIQAFDANGVLWKTPQDLDETLYAAPVHKHSTPLDQDKMSMELAIGVVEHIPSIRDILVGNGERTLLEEMKQLASDSPGRLGYSSIHSVVKDVLGGVTVDYVRSNVSWDRGSTGVGYKCCVVSGSLPTTTGQNVEIRLKVCTARHPVAFYLLDEYASHLQVLVAPTGAYHMYGSMLRENFSMIWSSWRRRVPRERRDLQYVGERGIKFLRWKADPVCGTSEKDTRPDITSERCLTDIYTEKISFAEQIAELLSRPKPSSYEEIAQACRYENSLNSKYKWLRSLSRSCSNPFEPDERLFLVRTVSAETKSVGTAGDLGEIVRVCSNGRVL